MRPKIIILLSFWPNRGGEKGQSNYAKFRNFFKIKASLQGGLPKKNYESFEKQIFKINIIRNSWIGGTLRETLEYYFQTFLAEKL